MFANTRLAPNRGIETKGTQMRKLVWLLLVLAVGCVKYPDANWSEWRGAQPVGGEPVGAVAKRDGIDFWSHGVPDRPYVVVAVLDQDFVEDQDYIERAPRAIIRAAREHGANAVVLREAEVGRSTVKGSVGMYGGHVGESAHRRLMYWVVRYVNPSH